MSAPTFAHASEAELARILDYYGIAWEYEPRAFPILWNLDGRVVESFSPDFYLPDLDIYVELTTLKQSLVRKKNRKLRRLRELYPDVNIKLFYARDFRALMLKYGRIALADSFTGAEGQAAPGQAGVAGATSVAAIPTIAEGDAATADQSTVVGAAAGAPEAGPPTDRGGRRRRGRRSIPASQPVSTP